MLPPGSIEAFGLYLLRTSALVLAAPLFGTASSFQGYKIALILALASVLFVANGAPLLEPVGAVGFGVLALRELVIGLSLAFVLHLVVLGVRVGSELVGHEMAFTMSNVVDPTTGEATPLLSRVYETLFLLALLAVDGHQWLVRALAESYERAPVGELAFGAALPGTLLGFFGDVFAAGVAFAAPVLVLLMLVSVVVGLLARAVPQINVLEFGFNLRIVVGLGALALLAPTLTPALGGLLERFMDGLEAGLDALET